MLEAHWQKTSASNLQLFKIAHPAEAAAPTADDEKIKMLLDGLQTISAQALQILAFAIQKASQQLDGETLQQVGSESSKQKTQESSRGQRSISGKAFRFDPSGNRF